MKRVICAFLALIMLAGALVACGTDGTTAETTPAETTPALPAELVISTPDMFNYTIVRSKNATTEVIALAMSLRDSLNNMTTATGLKVTEDWVKKGEDASADACEIVLGITEHPDMIALSSGLAMGAYAIKIVGSRILLAGHDKASLLSAVNELKRAIVKKDDGSLVISRDFAVQGSKNEYMSALPQYSISKPGTSYDTGDDCTMIHVKRTNTAEYDDYLAALEKAGYTLYTKRSANANRFATYTGHGSVVNVCFTNYSKEVRILVEPESSTGLPPRAEDSASVKKTTTPSVNLVGLGYNLSGGVNEIGLCMIFVLPDGRLIVVDGGYRSYNNSDNPLLKAMKEVAPDPNNITVAAWFLTHSHIDHLAAVQRFAESSSLKKSLTVERFVVNFPTKEHYEHIDDEALADDLRALLPRAFPNAQIIKAHTGQMYDFGCGATVEMLYTYDDYMPKMLDWNNTSSLVFRVKLEGKTCTVLGDATHATGHILVDMYGNYLRSDMVQLSHHGVIGIIADVYNYIKAPVLLWPATDSAVKKFYKDSYNVAALNHTRDLYVANTGVTTLKMPYAIKNNKSAVLNKILKG